MRSYKKYKTSQFSGKPDVENEPEVTIEEVVDRDLARPGEKTRIKPCANCKGLDKPLVLNMVNLAAIATIAGTEDMDQWRGTRIVLYWDPNVAYGPDITGGIRVRAPRKPLAKLVRKSAPPPVEQENGEEEMPC